MSSTQTTHLILDALRPSQTPQQWTSAQEQAQIDWDRLAVHAIVLGLAPQLHQRFTSWGLAVPPRPGAKLAVTYQATQQRNTAIFAQLGEVLAACQANGLNPIALKGVHLAAHYYDTPALRPMNDIDLLFPPEQLPAAEAILAHLGYDGKHKSAELGPGVTKHTSTFRRSDAPAGTTPNPYLSTASDRTVEPHTSLEESWFGLKVDITPGVRQRAENGTLGNHPGRVLAHEDLLLHLCVHLCFHLIQGAPALVQITDLLVVTRCRTTDWDTFCQRAQARRAAPFALAALSLAHKLLDAPIPQAALQHLQAATPSPLRRRIAHLDLAHVMQRTQQKPLNNIPQRIWRGFQDRAETARWAPDWRGRWQVWRTALLPGKSDTGRMLQEQLRS